MIVYVFAAPPQSQGQPQPFQAGDVTQITLACPDGTTPQQAIEAIRASGITQHMAGRIRFGNVAIQHVDAPRVLMINRIPTQPVLSREHVQGGMPTGVPTGQNQDRPGGPRDGQSGFEQLGDDALSMAGDAMFGAADDGTVSDMVQGQEVPRSIPRHGQWD
jgi:hypothetical protein